jgi:ABC-type amino acid transport substrate-binding protein
MWRTTWLGALVGFAAWLGGSADAGASDAPVLRVVVPQPESSDDARGDYPRALLRMALEHSGRRFALSDFPARTTQARSLRLLAAGEGLDVVWTVTSRQREAKYLPIRIPIDRGLIGWRELLVRGESVDTFAGVRSLADLSRLRGEQGIDWPDLPVLRANGLLVFGAPGYENLFAMLAHGRVDYFPRAVGEGERELATRGNLGLVVERKLLLHYPSALYFFVAKSNRELADAIEAGLNRCLADGSFQQLFERTYGDAIRDRRLAGRRILELDNPGLPESTPLGRSELWLDATEFGGRSGSAGRGP